ncbi:MULTISPECIES: Cof-type HAD-IIB family hydrolase [Moraxella]|uniref:Hydrolase HAD superfamily n=1 Tax=Moraxella catarrhalis TaxID=480 RepID=A0A7Z0UXQ9_MORCA|nr:Cof-type HAD-IIB family hydrolase [Moraxella catarrhalis]OAV00163.1 Hydrolase HAD superfamily [Moraxella catarrhalis]STY81174.1 Putative bifunctional phosphatase/peptidyl-prolyl cis-trans isomerase [Moraxella catarrhalis]
MPNNSYPLPKIIFFDIDDTLYIKDEGRIPQSVKPALLALKNQGVLLAIATGRSLGIMPVAVRELIDEIGIDYLLTINGQYNEYAGKKLFDFPLKKQQVKEILAVFEHRNIATAIMTKTDIFCFNQSKHLKTALGSLGITPILANKEGFDFDQPIYQILAFYEDHEAQNIVLPPDIKTTRWHRCAVDVLDHQSSKARSIAKLLNELNISKSDAAAFGDGLNDIEMFKLVGTAIAMDNGHPDLKQHADIICPRHDQDGIENILKALKWN